MSIHDFNKGMTDEQLNSQAPILNRSLSYDAGRDLARQMKESSAQPGLLTEYLAAPDTRLQKVAGTVTFLASTAAALILLRAEDVGLLWSSVGAFVAGLLAAGAVVAVMKLIVPIAVVIALVLAYHYLLPLFR